MSPKNHDAEDDPSASGRAAIAVDLVVFAIIDSELKVLLNQRERQPFKGTWSLPGGFVRIADGPGQGESLNDSARRHLAEQTGLPEGHGHLQQLSTFGRAGRDPRTRVIAVSWCALLPPEASTAVQPGGLQWFSVADDTPWMRLAFDHAEIMASGVERIQADLDRNTTAFELVPSTFTVGELRSVYEAIQGRAHDPRNFRRRFQRLTQEGIVEQAPGKRHLGKSRPAMVWRLVRGQPAG